MTLPDDIRDCTNKISLSHCMCTTIVVTVLCALNDWMNIKNIKTIGASCLTQQNSYTIYYIHVHVVM